MNQADKATIRAELKKRHTGTLRDLRDNLNCPVSCVTLSRILNGGNVSLKSWRSVAASLGLRLRQAPSTERRRELRQRCRQHGITLEDAAERWIERLGE